MVQKKKNKLSATALLEKNKEEGIAFLKENATQEGVVASPSGLQYKILTKGACKIPVKTSKVICHYKGELLDGTVFDSSYRHKRPETFYINELIRGWQEAMCMMPVGSIWQVYLPPHLAYGKEELMPRKGGECTLVFQIELIAIL
ncbi:FKBP-type peptidyl-prolyl cis-trans isomerase [Sphingobacterium sp. BIGb0165]|uniref:FKBP-type peptidyl-prolyl cis-trans isomerase n=1 Tax=Sphingobacterium sp. BIGb0165 TaxID=2940615 RepID=UPI00216A293E|nr:FKBP-type peptidyl-prolyl cis-trans isomerase [Sphingobacterium sp. BIGb0165]MCS4224332.1 FKBP-type peptidyl-prolyl cis-trans isomerase FklB [Sphingobacterium sp. BIGb0165]